MTTTAQAASCSAYYPEESDIRISGEEARRPYGIRAMVAQTSTQTRPSRFGHMKLGPARAEFDNFAKDYRSLHAANIRISGESPEHFAEYKVRDISALTGNDGEQVSRILDFGAGIGASVPYFRRYFPQARLTCVDISEISLKLAESRFPGEAKFQFFDGRTLPFSDQRFDLIFAACVFHHVDHAEHVSLLRELNRVLKHQGRLAIFEHNPLNPLTVYTVNACPFDKNSKLVTARVMRARFAAAGFPDARVMYRIFFPHILRALRPLEAQLTWLPLGAQYFITAKKL